jgi:hypothetical protein
MVRRLFVYKNSKLFITKPKNSIPGKTQPAQKAAQLQPCFVFESQAL